MKGRRVMENVLWIFATDTLILSIYLISMAVYRQQKSNDGHRYLVASFLIFIVGLVTMVKLILSFNQ